MDISLNIPATSAVAASTGPVLERAVTQKVTPVDSFDAETTRPAEKPFVAQVVEARLSGTDFPQNPAEIVPEERTLRPYDVPMLPSTPVSQAQAEQQTDVAQTAKTPPEDAG